MQHGLKWLRCVKLMRQVNSISLVDDARKTLTNACLEKVKERSLERHLRLCKRGSTSANDCGFERCPAHANVNRRLRNAKCSNCGKTGHAKKMCRQSEKSVVKSSPSSSSGKSSGKGGTTRSNTDKCRCCGQFVHLIPDCPSRSGNRRHLSQVCQSEPIANANARTVEVEFDGLEGECKEKEHVCAMSVCNESATPSVKCGGNLLSMIMDSGAEEHVFSLADWRRLGEPLLRPA